MSATYKAGRQSLSNEERATRAHHISLAANTAFAQAAQPTTSKPGRQASNNKVVTMPERLLDCSRIVAMIDMDYFYAQVEELNDPTLRNCPMAVTQKFIVVTCNYPARAAGVGKLMSIEDALRSCPSLRLVNGEDLTDYRRASDAVHRLLSAEVGECEHACMDEFFVDLTDVVAVAIRERQLICGNRTYALTELQSFAGHVLGDVDLAQVYDRRLRAHRASTDGQHADERDPLTLQRLRVASHYLAYLRALIRERCGLTSCGGLAVNKLLAKMVASVHKPQQQTLLFPHHATVFVGERPLRAIPGIGRKLRAQLESSLGITSTLALRQFTVEELCEAGFAAAIAERLFDVCRGCCTLAVRDRGAPKSISVEDSFRACTTLSQCHEYLQLLSVDLLRRLTEDRAEHRREPNRLSVYLRHVGHGYRRASKSTAFPSDCGQTAVFRLACVLLRDLLSDRASYCLTLLGLRVSFAQNCTRDDATPSPNSSILRFMRPVGRSSAAASSALGTAVESNTLSSSLLVTPSPSALSSTAVSRSVNTTVSLSSASSSSSVPSLSVSSLASSASFASSASLAALSTSSVSSMSSASSASSVSPASFLSSTTSSASSSSVDLSVDPDVFSELPLSIQSELKVAIHAASLSRKRKRRSLANRPLDRFLSKKKS